MITMNSGLLIDWLVLYKPHMVDVAFRVLEFKTAKREETGHDALTVVVLFSFDAELDTVFELKEEIVVFVLVDHLDELEILKLSLSDGV